MKTEILKSFSSFGCDAQLQRITFEKSKQVEFCVCVRYLITPKDWNSNFQFMTFGSDEYDANACFSNCISDFI